MSMISAQIDELRELAGDGSMEWVAGPIRASVLRDAADTIWELRDDLQRANAENSRLRSELESVGTAAYLYGRSDLKAENAKLRELCSKLAQVVANDDVTFRKLREIAKRELGYDFIGAYDSSIGDMDQLPLFSDHMRELGGGWMGELLLQRTAWGVQ